jgi:hypothetical protein
MGTGALEPLVCAACGSSRLRGSRPHGLLERLDRRYRGTRYHVCKDCGARGTHLGRRHASSRARTDAKGRPRERRDLRATRLLATRRTGAVILAIALGAWFGFHVSNCASRSAEQRPPDAAAQ